MTDTFPAGETFVGFFFLNGATAPPSSCGLGSTISCSTGSMPSGSFVAARIVVHTAATLADGAVLNNTAVVTASSADVDPNSANNQSTAATVIGVGSGGGGGDTGGGGVDAAATPELDSLLLFGSGLSGLAGYATLRLRSRRRPRQ